MALKSSGYLLTIAGCPIVFTSPGIGPVNNMNDLPITDPDWPTGIVLTTQVANGALDPKSISEFSEEIDLLNGNFDADGITFKIHDIQMSYEGETVNIASKLFTSNNQETCQLDESFLIADTSPIVIKGQNIVADSGGFIWIDGEAIRKDSTSGANVNVDYRAALGTHKQDHIVSTADNYYPTVFLSYPGPYRAKVILWRRDEAGTWSAIWRGIGGRAPRASGNGAPIELQCEHLWTDFKGKTYDLVEAKTRLAGWDARKLSIRKWSNPSTPSIGDTLVNSPLDTPGIVEYNERDFASQYLYGIYKVWYINSTTGKVFDQWVPAESIERDLQDGHFTLKILDAAQNDFHADIAGCYGVPAARVDPGAFRSFGVSDQPQTVDGKRICKIPVPEWTAFQTFKNGATKEEDNHLIIDRVDSLEEFPIVNSGSINTCQTTTVWVGEIDKEDYSIKKDMYGSGSFYLLSEPTAYPNTPYGGAHGERKMIYYCSASSYDWSAQYAPNASGAGRAPLYFASGSAIFRGKRPNEYKEAWRTHHFVMQEVELEHKMSLKSRHWLDLLRYGIIERFHYSGDFDFSFNSYAMLKLQNPSFTTELFLEPKQQYGQIVQGLSQYYGIVPTTTAGGKMRFVKLVKPSLATSSSFTFTSADMVKGQAPTWEDVGDSVVTAIKVSSKGLPGDTLLIRNQYAKGKYGDVQTVEIDLEKIGIEHALFQRVGPNQSPEGLLTADLTSRFFSLFREPYRKYTIHLPLSYVATIFPGQVITVSEWLLPNGSGGRGLSQAKLLIQKKATNLQEGRVSITGVLFPQEVNSGFSPCCRLSAVNAGTKTVTVNTNYLSTGRSSTEAPTDYAGSNLAGYPHTANDGGIGWFNVGDKVQLILRNSTTFTAEDFTIASKTSTTITFAETINTSPTNWPVHAAADNVDIRFSSYSTSGLQTAQKSWAFIGDGDTRRLASLTAIKRFR